MNQSVGRWRSIICVAVSMVGIAVAAVAAEPATAPVALEGVAVFALPTLTYSMEALEPYISARTMAFHYTKHHQGYVDNLNKLVAGTALAGRPLERVVVECAGGADTAVFNNAAQAWNHAFFWRSMKPGGGGPPLAGRMMDLITKSFGSFDQFKNAFMAAAAAQFGSGWIWLVQENDALIIVKTSNSDTPIVRGQTPLLTCDVWEHAYYLDYQNRRKDFVQAFIEHLVDWEFAASQLK